MHNYVFSFRPVDLSFFSLVGLLIRVMVILSDPSLNKVMFSNYCAFGAFGN